MKNIHEVAQRRAFIQRAGAVAAVAISFTSLRAMALEKRVGKLTLNEGNLNAKLLATGGDGRDSKGMMTDAQKRLAGTIVKDPSGWITSNFVLTPAQEAELKAIDDRKWEEIKKQLRLVEEHGGTIRTTITGAGRQPKDGGAPASKKTIKVDVKTVVGEAHVEIVKE